MIVAGLLWLEDAIEKTFCDEGDDLPPRAQRSQRGLIQANSSHLSHLAFVFFSVCSVSSVAILPSFRLSAWAGFEVELPRVMLPREARGSRQFSAIFWGEMES